MGVSYKVGGGLLAFREPDADWAVQHMRCDIGQNTEDLCEGLHHNL